ncbi:MAG: hypothetical protein HC836_44595 [Richelia sp. RM2_1_2]|nr:hypothetical protein [Richelia sp. RM2_1_2]
MKIYSRKTKVPGSKFEEYALLSKLSNKWLVKSIRFIDPIIDDDGRIYPFVRREHILFLNGLAIGIESMIDFLDKVIADSYTDYPTTIRIDRGENQLLSLLDSLSNINVISIAKLEGSACIDIMLSSNNPESSVYALYNQLAEIVNEPNCVYENEITDF